MLLKSLFALTYIFALYRYLNSDLLLKIGDFLKKRSRGEQLIKKLSHSSSCPKKLEHYKFFTPLIELLYQYQRKHGASIRPQLIKIRRGIYRDLGFERKLSRNIQSALINFLVISLMSWAFILTLSYSLELSLEDSNLKLIAFLQIFGVILFFVLYFKRKNFLFSPFEKIFSTLLTLECLSQSGVSVCATLEKANMLTLKKIDRSELQFIIAQISNLIYAWKQGNPITSGLEEIGDELWFLLDIQFDKFLKEVLAIKFLCLSIFFLSAHFIYILEIFSKLL